ncbi:hypothetical protein Taro_031831 [Colocasia esculenta]|uniref:Uncharacterized protein n=1 Tax=Colocasia esculenta TaxID=4460 RepID=A0A843W4A6_COLES|nr:hypothetical protein [Colocasia esculenta]
MVPFRLLRLSLRTSCSRIASSSPSLGRRGWNCISNLRMLLGLALGIEMGQMPLSSPSVHNVDLGFVVLPSLAYSHGAHLEQHG